MRMRSPFFLQRKLYVSEAIIVAALVREPRSTCVC
jgi:hypothetical protein